MMITVAAVKIGFVKGGNYLCALCIPLSYVFLFSFLFGESLSFVLLLCKWSDPYDGQIIAT